jgi:hypothetical protein
LIKIFDIKFKLINIEINRKYKLLLF